MTKKDWVSVARYMLASRLIDEIEENELVPQGKVLYQFSSKGHELAQIILAHQITHIHDAATCYYRSRPFVLAVGMSIKEAFAGPLANSFSRNGGRDIGVVHNLVSKNGPTVLPASGDVGAQFTPAVGWAQSIVYRTTTMNDKSWEGACAVAMGGDASCATNGFWSALTIAATQSYPMLFFIEDNTFGISVPSTYQTPGGDISANLASFANLRIIKVDGTDPEEMARAASDAVSLVRSRISPVLLHVQVPRICGHSGADNQSYKSEELLSAEKLQDPLLRIKSFLLRKKILTAASWAKLEAEVEQEVRNELNEALNAPPASTDDVYHHSYFQGISQSVGGMRSEGISIPEVEEDENLGKRMNLISAVQLTLRQELTVNNRLLTFGEDVGVKGGVHGATVGLQSQFGVERVFDTSLSEEGIIGRSIGMAFAGLVPVPEIQFRKYLDPAMEQINDLGTIRWRTNNQFAAPVIVRIPVGHSKRTGDPWHSVSGEAIFAHTIGWRVAMPSNVVDAVGLLRTALRGNDPTFFLEHRNLLDTSMGRGLYPGHNFALPFGKANIVQKGTDVTIVSWGEMLHRCIEAAKSFPGQVEVIDLRTIAPWDSVCVLESVKKTNRCVIAHEDALTAGFGAEIASVIADQAFSHLDAPVARIATRDIPIPYNIKQMEVVIPTVESIVDILSKTIRY